MALLGSWEKGEGSGEYPLSEKSVTEGDACPPQTKYALNGDFGRGLSLYASCDSCWFVRAVGAVREVVGVVAEKLLLAGPS